jgi:rRNA-processing protein FCF1
VTDGDASKDASGKKIVVTRDSEISEDLQVKKVKLQSVENKRSGL